MDRDGVRDARGEVEQEPQDRGVPHLRDHGLRAKNDQPASTGHA
jgi:hypothetical protein